MIEMVVIFCDLDDLNVLKCLGTCLRNVVPLHFFIEKELTRITIFVQID
jgi:hypothetical protein